MNRTSAVALLVCTVLTAPTGCAVTETSTVSGSESSPATGPGDTSGGIRSAGTSTSRDASDAMEAVSSGIYDLIKVKGKASDGRPGVQQCPGKDRDKYFQIFHPWSFYPTSPAELDAAMENLKEGLPRHGWKIVQYGPDTSVNKNVVLIADNDEQKAGVHITRMKKRNPPKLSLMVVSGCYQVPDGQEVEHF
ncbi:hypothetical protein HKX69_13030 [Streptomyces argyrophyllae]|uniref:Lipoprotein n=1 Tax=Streptomyces argyrophylli TaxID=2726118 RepID=A0A6M4PN31_9ACTN|nr:hypothetical protein [Streptomyces argyrophyllae]QJS10320.1 hypothetical protein HKX69_13030 [Streptomyces argyrophyllae]